MIDSMSFTFHPMIVIAFFHDLNMYCRQIRDTIAECKTEMHKKTRKTGTWEVYIFAVSSNVMWHFQNIWCKCFEDLWNDININSTQYFCTAQMCICTVLASPVIVCCMMVQFIIYLLCTGLKVLSMIIMCWAGTVFFFFAWPKFTGRIKIVYIFVKEIYMYTDA